MRNPYVGEGADGARRSAAIDRSEADGLDPGPYRDAVLASAARWEDHAAELEAAEVLVGEVVDDHDEDGTLADLEAQEAEDLVMDAEVILSPRELAAQRLVAIAALEQLVRKLKAEHREQAASVYDRAHMKDPVHLNGRELGQARTDAVKGGWKVADAAAWATYAASVYDDAMVEQVTTVVDPELTKRALAGLQSGEWETLNVDGEVVDGPPPGLEYVPPGVKLVVTAAKDAAAQVTHLLGPVARQLGLPELEAE